MIWSEKQLASLVSSFFLMVSPQENIGADGACLFADCAVAPQPSPAQLAEIALATAESARALLEVEPRVAMLSFSTQGSADHPPAAAGREATKTLRARAPHLIADGELQLDAAIVPEIAARKAPGSAVRGLANVFIFPTSIPVTSPTNSPSVSAAAPLSAPSCKDSPGPRTTSPAARAPKTSRTWS